MKLNVLNKKNEVIKSVEYSDDSIIRFDPKFMGQYRKKMTAVYKSKLPLAHTKTISEVSGTTKKPFAQKGTGNARQGTKRSPHHVGGATIFGPKAVRRSIRVQKSETSLARSMMISKFISDEKIFVISDYSFESVKTKMVSEFLKSFGIVDKNVLVMVHDEVNQNAILSSRNIRGLKVKNFKDVTVHDLMNSKFLFITEDIANMLFN
jgi:large subunit ribosomal protein L4